MMVDDPFAPLTNEQIRERIALVSAAKAARAARGLSTALPTEDLDRILGPSIEDVVASLPPHRKYQVYAKIYSGGVVGVTRNAAGQYEACLYHQRKKVRRQICRTLEDAVRTRNEWVREIYPGCPEYECDLQAARRRWQPTRYKRT